jgi:hypothetical protein
MIPYLGSFWIVGSWAGGLEIGANSEAQLRNILILRAFVENIMKDMW